MKRRMGVGGDGGGEGCSGGWHPESASTLGVRTREVKQMGRENKIFVSSCSH